MKAKRRKQRRVVHSPDAVRGIREAARATAWVRDRLAASIRPGMTTLEIDQLGESLIRQTGGSSAFNGYHGYPGQVCVSVDDVIVHGVGSADTLVRPGQLVSMDVGVKLNGYIGDSAVTVRVGGVASEQVNHLLQTTLNALDAGIAAARSGNCVNDISRAVEQAIKPNGYGIVRDFVGHGVGRELHEPPEIPNFTQSARGCRLVPGMVLAIEPMLTLGGPEVVVDSDGWTARTSDGSVSAHCEHMILITENGPEILTWQTTPSE